jgi:hypothetical protein
MNTTLEIIASLIGLAPSTDDILASLISRSPSTLEDQKEAIARHAAGGFRALDLSVEVREAIALVVCRRFPKSTNWIAFETMKTWGRSYSIHVANEIRLSRREVTSAYYLLRSMESRGLMRSLPRQKPPPRSGRSTLQWEITDLGRARVAELLLPDLFTKMNRR